MRRHVLDAEIARLEQTLPGTRKRFGQRSKEYTGALEKLKSYRHDRMMRDCGFRSKRRKAA